jgi:hypothetical protein
MNHFCFIPYLCFIDNEIEYRFDFVAKQGDIRAVTYLMTSRKNEMNRQLAKHMNAVNAFELA